MSMVQKTYGPGLDYASYRIAPRAPRAAVVLPGGHGWQHYARRVLHEATRVWGGAGAVLVPHTAGTVHPRLLSAVAAYDPDYVLLAQPTIGELEAMSPGLLPIAGEDGQPLEVKQRAAPIESSGDQTLPTVGDDEARQAVIDACSPYRRWDADGQQWDEEYHWWSGGPPGQALTSAVALGADGTAAVSVRPDAAGDAALALTARYGTFHRPSPAASGAACDPDDEARTVLWLLSESSSGRPPAGMLTGDLDAAPSAFQAGSVGLTWVGGIGARRLPTLVVAGDTADDFALALMWDRLYGNGLWLPTGWWPTAGDRVGDSAAASLRQRADMNRQSGWPLRLMSVSVALVDLDRLLAPLSAGVSHMLGAGRSRRSREPVARLPDEPWPAAGALHLAVAGQFDQQFGLPVRRHGGADSTVEMAAPPPPPVVTADELRGRLGALRWEVDLQAGRSPTPAGRGLDGHALLADSDDQWMTWVRRGRDGTSYNAQRYDLVLAGSTPEATLARPRLRELDLLSWANALGLPRGQSYRLSDAGLRVDVLTRMAGDRDHLAELLTGLLLPALRAFNTHAKSTSAAYPGKEGVALIDGGYLHLDGIAAFAGCKPDDARPVTDQLLTAGLLRRGLILKCGSCMRPSFLTVDQLGQRNQCPRCNAHIELEQARWQQPVAEPLWFYDLHPAARELFSQHGDVPLQLSAYLRGQARQYNDLAEVELVDQSTGSATAEADLVAHADGDLLTAEAKSNDNLGDSRKKVVAAAAKRASIARALRADEVILATTRPRFDLGSVEAVRHALTSQSWPVGHPPRLRLVCGLGGQVSDEHVNLSDGTKAARAALGRG